MPPTRSSFTCPILGTPRSLPQSQLPTLKDVILACFDEKFNNTYVKKLSAKTPFLYVANVVADQVLALYEKASIPAASKQRIIARIVSLHTQYQNLLKSYQSKNRKDSSGLNRAVQSFIDKSNLLFDVAFCKCPIDLANPEGSLCHCADRSKKVPAIEKRFLLDQRTTRLMIVGHVDKKVSALLRKKEKRNSVALQPKPEDFVAASSADSE